MRLANIRQALGAMLLVIALAACANPGSSSPEPTASDALLASLQPFPQERLVFRLNRFDVITWVPYVTLYADGRLLTWDGPNDTLIVQTLNSSGSEAFLAEVQATGSFAASHDVGWEPLPGVEVPGMDLPADRFTLAAPGAEPVIVTSNPINDPQYFKSSAERDLLIALADRVIDTSWLSPDAWVDQAAKRFAPDAYVLFSGVTPSPGICPPGSVMEICQRDVATIALPFALPADGIGPPFTSADGTQSIIDHCAIITPQLVDALTGVLWPQVDTAAGHFTLSATLPWREHAATYDLTIRPLFPEEAATCAGKSLPPTIGP